MKKMEWRAERRNQIMGWNSKKDVWTLLLMPLVPALFFLLVGISVGFHDLILRHPIAMSLAVIIGLVGLVYLWRRRKHGEEKRI